MKKNSVKKIKNAAKWSGITELSAKIVSPISNMILARLLTPDAFGVVATAIMIFSFADMFTDSGFQKYLVQQEFKNDEDLHKTATVAFWTNLFISLFLWSVISIFSEQLAVIVGNPGLGIVFIVSCISLPLTSFSSIQMALFKRNLDFKILFKARFVGILLPLVVTVPLAFLLRSFWALIIGIVAGNIVNAIVLTWLSKWKPNLFYDFKLLKEMFSFSIWSLVEAFFIWLGSYMGVFIVGKYLTPYYVGVYKISMSTVNQIIYIVSSAIAPVLFSSLSRLQNNQQEFEKTLLNFESYSGMFIVPMGVGIYLYKDVITSILLGKQWVEATGFIGLWALVSALKVLLSNYCSETYRALGKPKVSVVVQAVQIVFLAPLLIYGAKQSFTILYILRSLAVFEMILMNMFMMKFVIHISPWKMVKAILPFIGASTVMYILSYGLRMISSNVFWGFISMAICAIGYFCALYCCFPKYRQTIKSILKCLKRRKIVVSSHQSEL